MRLNIRSTCSGSKLFDILMVFLKEFLNEKVTILQTMYKGIEMQRFIQINTSDLAKISCTAPEILAGGPYFYFVSVF